MTAINEHLKAAINDVLSDADLLDRLGILAEQMKPESPFRDAVFIALRRRNIDCRIESEADSGGKRTDLVLLHEPGRAEAVEFKFWLAPDTRTPAKIIRDALADRDKHGGQATIVTLFSDVRSVKYFRNASEYAWNLEVSRATVADAIGASEHWQATAPHWVVDVCR